MMSNPTATTTSPNAAIADTVKVEYNGSLQQKITHLPSGQTFFTDGPSVAGGQGEVSAPTDLLIGAFVSCAMTIMALLTEKAGFKFDGSYAECGKKASMQEFRITDITVKFHLKKDFPESLRKELESAVTDMCIVGRSLSSKINRDITFTYN